MITHNPSLYDEICRYYEETEEDKDYLRDTISAIEDASHYENHVKDADLVLRLLHHS